MPLGDIRGVDSRLVISQSNWLLINVDNIWYLPGYRLKLKRQSNYNNHDDSATVKTCHTADVKAAGGFSMSNSEFFAVTFDMLVL